MRGLNNFIAFFSFIFAGFLLGVVFYFQNGSLFFEINNPQRFWQGIFWVVLPNVLAVYFLYKALEIADLSYLMPFMTLTSVFIIIPPIFLLGEIPSRGGVAGIFTIVAGAILMEFRKKKSVDENIVDYENKKRNNRRGLIYFLVTAACYVIIFVSTKIVVIESSPLAASFFISLLISACFIPIVFLSGEWVRIKETVSKSNIGKKLIVTLMLAGGIIAVEDISINLALVVTDVSYVMAIKRTMPFFAFIIGYLYFKEREHLKRKLMATALMVAGAILIVLFN